MDKEPMDWGTLALAVWPLWIVLAALGVWWLLARYGYAPADTYEEPCGCEKGRCCGFCPCCEPERLERERKYHGDDSWGR